MTRFFARRVAQAVLLLVVVSAGVFALAALAPGDYFAELRSDPRVDPAAIETLRARYGLDRPVVERYGVWLGEAVRGDLGVSLAYNMPVTELLAPRAGKSFELAAMAWVLGWVLSLALALGAAVRPGGWMDRATGWVVSGLLVLPEVLLAPVLALVAARTGILRLGGFELALLALTPGVVPVLLRHGRAALEEAAGAAYVEAARARGIAGWRLWLVYIFPAAANPLISLFGMSFAGVLSGSLVVEAVTGWPGMGPLFLDSIAGRDFYVVVAVTLMMAALLAVGNLAADTMLYVLDPRLRRPQ
jgi:peptide/nickel transport system permease protein